MIIRLCLNQIWSIQYFVRMRRNFRRTSRMDLRDVFVLLDRDCQLIHCTQRSWENAEAVVPAKIDESDLEDVIHVMIHRAIGKGLG